MSKGEAKRPVCRKWWELATWMLLTDLADMLRDKGDLSGAERWNRRCCRSR